MLLSIFEILLQNHIVGTFAGSIVARLDIRYERLSTYNLEHYIAANSGNLIICFVKLIRNSIAPNVFRFGIDFASEVDCLTTLKKQRVNQLNQAIAHSLRFYERNIIHGKLESLHSSGANSSQDKRNLGICRNQSACVCAFLESGKWSYCKRISGMVLEVKEWQVAAVLNHEAEYLKATIEL